MLGVLESSNTVINTLDGCRDTDEMVGTDSDLSEVCDKEYGKRAYPGQFRTILILAGCVIPLPPHLRLSSWEIGVFRFLGWINGQSR